MQAGADAALGIEQELGGSHHPFVFLQPGADFHPIIRLDAGFDRPRLEPPFAEIDDHSLFHAGADQGFAGNVQHLGTRRGMDDHIGEHVELEPFAGIGKAQPGAQSPSFGVYVGVDVFDRAFPDLARRVRQSHFGFLPDRQPAGLLLEHFDLNPNRGRIGQRHQFRLWGNVHALADIEH